MSTRLRLCILAILAAALGGCSGLATDNCARVKCRLAGWLCDPADGVCKEPGSFDAGGKDAGADAGATLDAGDDAGPEDAGPDGGEDGGEADAGPEDAGLDGGDADGGFDGGSGDGGSGDAGSDGGDEDGGPGDAGVCAYPPNDAGFSADGGVLTQCAGAPCQPNEFCMRQDPGTPSPTGCNLPSPVQCTPFPASCQADPNCGTCFPAGGDAGDPCAGTSCRSISRDAGGNYLDCFGI